MISNRRFHEAGTHEKKDNISVHGRLQPAWCRTWSPYPPSVKYVVRISQNLVHE
ncbi:unnamed protein product, partial [Ascophyllum nodosum]